MSMDDFVHYRAFKYHFVQIARLVKHHTRKILIYENRLMDENESRSPEPDASAQPEAASRPTEGTAPDNTGSSDPAAGVEAEVEPPIPAPGSEKRGNGASGQSLSTGESHTGGRSNDGHSRLFGLGVTLIIAGVVILGARVWWVEIGILYGASSVTQIDVVVGALIVIGTACIAAGRRTSARKARGGRRTKAREKENNGKANAPESGSNVESVGKQWTNWASGAAALAGAGALVVSLLNLIQPLNPPGLAMPACPGARVNNVPFVGITAAVGGVNSRQGPARSYLPDGRYPDGCSIGFSAYCLGDPIGESGGTGAETWVTSRWLLVAKQSSKLAIFAARILSGEKQEPAFVSDAFIFPETSYDLLPRGGPKQCPENFPYPAKADLQPFDAHAGTFTAVARYATNMGFAVWVPPGQGFMDGNSYSQIVSSSPSAFNNPGQTTASGAKSVIWDYADTLLAQLRPRGSSGNHSFGHVVIMAIPCLAPSIPASTSTAAISGYKLSSKKSPIKASNIPQGADYDQLARAACEAAT
jgi:hypothetical protein